MIMQIQELINQGEYGKARQALELYKEQGGEYTDVLAILESTLCQAEGNKNGMFEAIKKGLMYASDNYELYYMLGCYYGESNLNQAYLCWQNALFYCTQQTDREFLEQELEKLRKNGEITVKNTAIIIVSYNCCYMMQKNIECIRETLPSDTYAVYVVDNASTDGVREWLAAQSDLTFIKNDENVGFAPACNQGVLATEKTDYEQADIFLLNNDTRLTRNALFWLKMGLYENDKIGAVGSVSNYAGNNQQIDVTFELPGDYLKYGESVNIPIEFPYEERVRLSGFAMLVRREIWDTVGGMDEQFSPGYFEDDDLSMKILETGHRLLVCKNSFIYHAGSQSFAGKTDLEELLLSHYEMFINKYGFPILDYADYDTELLHQIPYESDASFNILQVGSGLGADLKMLRTQFPNANIVGVETNDRLRGISGRTDVVFSSIGGLAKEIKQAVFHVLFIKPEVYVNITDSELKQLRQMCVPDCIGLPANKQAIFYEQIKLIIWDLDDTFWKGTLSEGKIEAIASHVQLIKDLTDCGIINSISSKNDEEPVMYVLEQLGLTDYFVFNDINWNGKGEQIKHKIERMNLRAENVLFLDDNVRNLEEAKYFNEKIMVAEPDAINGLIQYASGLKKSDLQHNRLNQYKILQKKTEVQDMLDSKEQFLYYSGIKVTVVTDCEEQIDRIAELVSRTNQLNYTKKRLGREELKKLLKQDGIQSGYVHVNDRFGDYGIVGFYCYDHKQKKMLHFLFSCRIMGMGVEQSIYTLLGSPEIEVVPPVAVGLEHGKETPWIHVEMRSKEGKAYREDIALKEDDRIKILLKGPCDLGAIDSYLTSGNVTKEFNYVNDKGFITTGQNHSMHIWESAHMSREQITEMLQNVPFITLGDFDTSLFEREYGVICYSLLTDCHAGLYRNKKSGGYISFGSRNFDLTDPANWQGYIEGSIVNHLYPFTEDILRKFSEEWEYVGATKVEALERNLEYMYNHIKGEPLFVLMLGSELEYEGENAAFAGHASFHRDVNDMARRFAKGRDRVKLIEATKYIRTQSDYVDCIDHYSRNVYYEMAQELNGYITNVTSC